MMELIMIELEGKNLSVSRGDYVRLKTGDLKEFGYTTITMEVVNESLQQVLNGKPETELDVIALFIAADKPRKARVEPDDNEHEG